MTTQVRLCASVCIFTLFTQACAAPPPRVAPPVVVPPISDTLHIIEGSPRASGAKLLTIDLRSNKVTASAALGNQAAVGISADGQFAYVFNDASGANLSDPAPGVLRAINLDEGTDVWQLPLPARPFAAPWTGVWLSNDERRVYPQSTKDGLSPRMLTVDAQTRQVLHDFSLRIPYPANEFNAFPIAWKLPWQEMFVVVSRDQLFAYDPATGQKSNAISLFKPGDRALVPQDMPQTTYVMDGVIDVGRRRLILATSTQEILWVDLTAAPFKVHRVASLPGGWRFGGEMTLLLHPDGKTLYAQVRPVYPVEQIMAVAEVLSFDTTTWQQLARHVLCHDPYGCESLFERKSPYSFGLLVHPRDNGIYVLTQHGLLRVDQQFSTMLADNLIKLDGLAESDWYTIIR